MGLRDNETRTSFNERMHKMAKKRKVAKKKKKVVKKKKVAKKKVKKGKKAKGLWSAADVRLLKTRFASNPTAKLAVTLSHVVHPLRQNCSRSVASGPLPMRPLSLVAVRGHAIRGVRFVCVPIRWPHSR